MDAIIASFVTGIFAVIVCIISSSVQNSKTRALIDEQNKSFQALIDYRLSELEKKQDKHNDVIERMYHVEQDVAVIKTIIGARHERGAEDHDS